MPLIDELDKEITELEDEKEIFKSLREKSRDRLP